MAFCIDDINENCGPGQGRDIAPNTPTKKSVLQWFYLNLMPPSLLRNNRAILEIARMHSSINCTMEIFSRLICNRGDY